MLPSQESFESKTSHSFYHRSVRHKELSAKGQGEGTDGPESPGKPRWVLTVALQSPDNLQVLFQSGASLSSFLLTKDSHQNDDREELKDNTRQRLFPSCPVQLPT